MCDTTTYLFDPLSASSNVCWKCGWRCRGHPKLASIKAFNAIICCCNVWFWRKKTSVNSEIILQHNVVFAIKQNDEFRDTHWFIRREQCSPGFRAWNFHIGPDIQRYVAAWSLWGKMTQIVLTVIWTHCRKQCISVHHCYLQHHDVHLAHITWAWEQWTRKLNLGGLLIAKAKGDVY